MYQVKDLTQLTVKDLWKEVKTEEDWWQSINERVLGMVKLILESSLEAEILEEIQADRYRRSHLRMGYRNGYYQRSLYTRFGIIKSLQVPRARERYESRILPRYQRRQEEINQMVEGMFLAGVSTRRVKEVLRAIKGERMSSQTVSNICRRLDRQVRQYHAESITERYVYLFLDGLSLKVKGAYKVNRRIILCAYGITINGKREIIDFRLAADESEAKWEAFLRNLYERGLVGLDLKLISTDGCPGLHHALETVYPYIDKQRCWAHKLRNVANRVRVKDRKPCLDSARPIYLAHTEREARKLTKEWEHKWQALYPNAVSCLTKDLDELLNFLKMPVNHRIKVRTTNVIERAFREVRRRVRPMSCFNNSASVDRIIFGVISHLNQNWKEKPLSEFTQPS